jgi:hypothetical protein
MWHQSELQQLSRRPHLYFQWLGRSKKGTPHNLDMYCSILFESHEAN